MQLEQTLDWAGKTDTWHMPWEYPIEARLPVQFGGATMLTLSGRKALTTSTVEFMDL